MSHTQFLDEMIREYLLYRGFGSTLKAFDAELKADKMKSFRVDKIIDQLIFFINSYDLSSLRELWGHLNRHMFSKLESNFLPMLPYVKNPEENPTFALHFTKQWQDKVLISLHNFLATIIQYMPTPTLMHYEEDVTKINKLEERNDSLKKRLALLLDKGPQASVTPCQVEHPPHLLDDFYVIAQENNLGESQARSLRNIIKNMSSSASPILGRKDVINKKRVGK
ncbi:WD repeat-containing protein 91 isoform X2 [Diabrotica virgifera virgifera]|uniref:WD repeat-containing protein 91 isoform X2 n=1 Tax=Diabrotica virgifera virgifera TaxID=50390 RepID=A0A6P7G0X1_DIAVI|nr:WD repeat-containing protein 91 isoform X2 [Diabrotica virgifera virgifera]